MVRSIIHLDLDAFFASVEQRDRPELLGRPVVVGGSRQRGVVCAASYEARAFGVRSAMSMEKAIRLCPAATVLPVRMEAYQVASARVFEIFRRYTDLVEPLSIDEAFLDVTGCARLFGTAREIAQRIREEVRLETGLCISAGIAPNKFLSKLASDHGKPDGLLEVRSEDIDSFLLPLPVSRIWGVGKVTARRLEEQGVRTVADLRRMSLERLAKTFGSAGTHLYFLARGDDERPVEAQEGLKSVGHEQTYARDLWGQEGLRLELLELSEKVGARLRRKKLTGRCIVLKVKYADFVSVTRSKTVGSGLDSAGEIFELALSLMAQTEAGRRPVRLLGISLSGLEEKGAGQGDLFARQDKERISDLDKAVDSLRERFGEKGVARGSLLLRGSGGKKRGDGGEGS